MSDSRITNLWLQATAAKAMLEDVLIGLTDLENEDPKFGLPVQRNLSKALRLAQTSFPSLVHIASHIERADISENRQTA